MSLVFIPEPATPTPAIDAAVDIDVDDVLVLLAVALRRAQEYRIKQR